VFDSLDVRSNSRGDKYHVLTYNLNMKVTAEDLEWMLYFQGKERGRAQIRIEYD
jgi:hypothetical protein